jgi:hypothetical protein
VSEAFLHVAYSSRGTELLGGRSAVCSYMHTYIISV